MDIYDIKEYLNALEASNNYKVINTNAGDLFFNNGFKLKDMAESIIDYGMFHKENNIEEFREKFKHDLGLLSKTLNIFVKTFDTELNDVEIKIDNFDVDGLVDKKSSLLVNNLLSKKLSKFKI